MSVYAKKRECSTNTGIRVRYSSRVDARWLSSSLSYRMCRPHWIMESVETHYLRQPGINLVWQVHRIANTSEWNPTYRIVGWGKCYHYLSQELLTQNPGITSVTGIVNFKRFYSIVQYTTNTWDTVPRLNLSLELLQNGQLSQPVAFLLH